MEADAAAAAAAPDSTARKARKSVRFNSTPEGAACDAALTLRARRGEPEHVVTVEDNTVAFSTWALGGQGQDLHPLPHTAGSQHGRRESGPAEAGGSVRKTPVAAALQALFADTAGVPRMTPLCASAAKGVTPAAAGARAPAPTPNTGERLPCDPA
jgi:hypothetical protein